MSTPIAAGSRLYSQQATSGERPVAMCWRSESGPHQSHAGSGGNMGLVGQRRRDGGMLPLASVSGSTTPIPLNHDLEYPTEVI